MIVRLVAVDPIQHDGKLIAPGESFDVPDDAAAPLLACGAARAQEPEPAAPVAAPAPRARRSVLG